MYVYMYVSSQMYVPYNFYRRSRNPIQPRANSKSVKYDLIGLFKNAIVKDLSKEEEFNGMWVKYY